MNSFHETNKYQDINFPVGVYRANIHSMQPPGRWLRDSHWHEELQFTLVTGGTVTIKVSETSYTAKEGEIIFINSGIIHTTTEISEDGSYASLNFPPRLLSFFPGSRMDQDYVLPFTIGSGKSSFLITPKQEWEKTIIGFMNQIIDFYLTNTVRGNEYKISTLIIQLWCELISNWSPAGQSSTTNIVHQERMQQILSYIYSHYMENISLSDLAGVVNVSPGECCRMFQETLQTTPHNYLKNYRIQMSIDLLHSNLSITDIAGQVGYNHVSNYIATFKNIIGCTPAKYRKSIREGALD